MAIPNTFTNGTVADAAEVNANFSYVEGLVPVGAVVPFLKNIGSIESGTSTTVTASKLIDSTATFQSNKVLPNQYIRVKLEFNPNTVFSTSSETYVVAFTESTEDNTNGFIINSITNELRFNNVWNDTVYCKIRFYYTDSSDAYSSEIYSSGSTWTEKTHINPNLTKYVWKVEVYIKRYPTVNPGNPECRNNSFDMVEKFSTVVSVNSETELTIADDYFTNNGVVYDITPIIIPSNNFVECNGQILDDSDSILDGQTIPDLNGNNNFLRGDSTSGSTATLAATGSADIPYYTVTYILRIK